MIVFQRYSSAVGKLRRISLGQTCHTAFIYLNNNVCARFKPDLFCKAFLRELVFIILTMKDAAAAQRPFHPPPRDQRQACRGPRLPCDTPDGSKGIGTKKAKGAFSEAMLITRHVEISQVQ